MNPVLNRGTTQARLTHRVKALTVAFALFTAALILLSSCASFGEIGNIGAQFAAGAGVISQNQADSIGAAAESAAKAFETLTPEQEYYIGRAVTANLVYDYPPLDNESANAYLNTLGQALAMASDKPYTFKGYRFLLLDSPEINAFAAPGGFIMITRGMLECASDEATLAAVLAHEIGHVQLEHGIKAIKASRWTDAITKTAVAGVSMSSEEMAQVTSAFDDSIGDITQTLVVNGYSRKQEKEADEIAAIILSRVGYSPKALIAMLQDMDARLDPGGSDFAATHPSPRDRIAAVKDTVDSLAIPAVQDNEARRNRYSRAFAEL